MHSLSSDNATSFLPRYTGVLLCIVLWLLSTSHGGQLSPYPESDSWSPSFTLKALDGKTHRLEDYRGKVVLVNFWASWCPPCLAELPGMQRLADQMTDNAFEILLVNVGESSFRVAKIMKLIGVSLPALLDHKGETFQAWGGSIYPTSFILDTEGKIRYVAYGPLEWGDEGVVATVMDLFPVTD